MGIALGKSRRHTRSPTRCERLTIGFPGAAHFPAQPCTGKVPVAYDGVRSDSQHFGRFIHAQTTEKAHLENFALALVCLRKALQREIQAHNLFHLVGGEHHGGIDWNVNRAASTLLAPLFSGVIHQNVPHHLGSDREKMRAVAPSGVYAWQ